MSTPNRPYFSNGQVLQSPPLTARVRSFFDNLYMFFGLYIISLFSFNPYTAAEASSFNVRNNANTQSRRPRWGDGGGGSGSKKGPGGGGPGSGGKGPWSGGGGSGGKKFGTVDDVRGPECGSCK